MADKEDAPQTETETDDIEPVPEETAENVADELRAAFAEHEKPSEETSAEPEPKPEPEPEPQLDLEQAAKPEPAEPAADGETQATEALAPPDDWSAADHELFHSATPDVQRWLIDKSASFQADYTAKTEGLANQRRRLEALDTVLAPRTEGFRMQGMDETAGLKQLFALSDFAAQRPAEFINWFAQNRQVDLAQLSGQPAAARPANGAEAAEQDYDDDPVVGTLQRQVADLQGQLKQAVNGMEERVNADSQRQNETQRAEMQRQIDAFANEKDEHGNSRYPHFNEVRDHMGVYLERQMAPDMKTAYDMAVRAHPEVSRKIVAAEKAKADAAMAQERRQHAAQARRAGASITGTPAGSTPRQPMDRAEDELAAVAREAGWSV